MAVVPELPEAERLEVVREAKAAALATNASDQPELLAVVVPALPRPERDELVADLLSGPERYAWEGLVATLGAQLTSDEAQRALDVALKKMTWRNWVAVAGLLPALDERDRPEAARSALALAKRVNWVNAPAVAALLRALPAGERDARLRAALRSIDETSGPDYGEMRTTAFRHVARLALAELFGESERAAIVAEARRFAVDLTGSERSSVLRAVAKAVPDDELPSVLGSVRAGDDADLLGELTLDIAPRLQPQQRVEATLAAIRFAREAGGPRAERAATLAFAEHLPVELLPAALEAARAVDDAPAIAAFLASVSNGLPEAQRAAALIEANAVAEQAAWPEAMLVLFEVTRDPALIRSVFARVQTMEPRAALVFIEQLAPYLERPEVDASIGRVVPCADERQRDASLAALARRLADAGAVDDALRLTAEIRRSEACARAFEQMAPMLDEPAARAAIGRLDLTGLDAHEEVVAVAALLGRIPTAREQLVLTASEAVARLLYAPHRARAFMALRPWLDESAEQAAWTALRDEIGTREGAARLLALGEIAPLLDDAELVDGFALSANTALSWASDEFLGHAVPEAVARLPRATLLGLWRGILRQASLLPRTGAVPLLRVALPLFEAVAGEDGAREAYAALRDAQRWWP
jgi:hypothetical protein